MLGKLSILLTWLLSPRQAPKTSSPFDEEIIIESVKKTNRVVIVDEDTPRASMASEFAAIISDKAFDYLDAPVKRVTAPHTPVPYNKNLEEAFMPDANDVVTTVKSIVD